MVAMIALIGLNLRAGLGALPPLLPDITVDLRLSSTGAGALTSVAVICMGACAPLGQRLAGRTGLEAALGWILAILAVGSGLRLLPGEAALFWTGAVVGGAMGAASALVPAVIGHHLSSIRGLATGVYSASLALGVAVAAGTAVPLGRLLNGWRPALAIWGLAAALTGLAWLVLQRRFPPGERGGPTSVAPGRSMPWRSPTARLVSLFLASQMVVGFSGLAWIPPLYASLGLTDDQAASRLVLFQLVQLGTMLTLPALSDHVRDRRPLLAFGLVCTCSGLVLVLADPLGLSVVAMLLFGAGVGAGSTLGLVLITDSATTPDDAARLGAMTLMISFLCAACGPALIGLLSDVTGSLMSGFAVLLLLSVAMLGAVVVYRPERRL